MKGHVLHSRQGVIIFILHTLWSSSPNFDWGDVAPTVSLHCFLLLHWGGTDWQRHRTNAIKTFVTQRCVPTCECQKSVYKNGSFKKRLFSDTISKYLNILDTCVQLVPIKQFLLLQKVDRATKGVCYPSVNSSRKLSRAPFAMPFEFASNSLKTATKKLKAIHSVNGASISQEQKVTEHHAQSFFSAVENRKCNFVIPLWTFFLKYLDKVHCLLISNFFCWRKITLCSLLKILLLVCETGRMEHKFTRLFSSCSGFRRKRGNAFQPPLVAEQLKFFRLEFRNAFFFFSLLFFFSFFLFVYLFIYLFIFCNFSSSSAFQHQGKSQTWIQDFFSGGQRRTTPCYISHNKRKLLMTFVASVELHFSMRVSRISLHLRHLDNWAKSCSVSRHPLISVGPDPPSVNWFCHVNFPRQFISQTSRCVSVIPKFGNFIPVEMK